jgi:hypothetical protein
MCVSAQEGNKQFTKRRPEYFTTTPVHWLLLHKLTLSIQTLTHSLLIPALVNPTKERILIEYRIASTVCKLVCTAAVTAPF